jgi:hypothetical protein
MNIVTTSLPCQPTIMPDIGDIVTLIDLPGAFYIITSCGMGVLMPINLTSGCRAYSYGVTRQLLNSLVRLVLPKESIVTLRVQ